MVGHRNTPTGDVGLNVKTPEYTNRCLTIQANVAVQLLAVIGSDPLGRIFLLYEMHRGTFPRNLMYSIDNHFFFAVVVCR